MSNFVSSKAVNDTLKLSVAGKYPYFQPLVDKLKLPIVNSSMCFLVPPEPIIISGATLVKDGYTHVLLGEPISQLCSSCKGNPPPTVTWKDSSGSVISSSSTVNADGCVEARLNISEILQSHDGNNYTCEADNEVNPMDSQSVYLVAKGRRKLFKMF